jgi:hypothetical protein
MGINYLFFFQFFKMNSIIFKYSENLLMTALRHEKENMAEFLISKGIDVSHEVELMVNFYIFKNLN